MARGAKGRLDAPWDTVPRTLIAAMIVTGGLLTLVSFAKYVDHGQLLSDLVGQAQHLIVRSGGGGTAR